MCGALYFTIINEYDKKMHVHGRAIELMNGTILFKNKNIMKLVKQIFIYNQLVQMNFINI